MCVTNAVCITSPLVYRHYSSMVSVFMISFAGGSSERVVWLGLVVNIQYVVHITLWIIVIICFNWLEPPSVMTCPLGTCHCTSGYHRTYLGMTINTFSISLGITVPLDITVQLYILGVPMSLDITMTLVGVTVPLGSTISLVYHFY